MDLTTRPTRARYLVLAFLGSLAFILYLDRVCIAKAEISIREDLGLSKAQMGYVFGAFTFAYGLFEVSTGRWGRSLWLARRFDPHRGVVVGVHGTDGLRLEILVGQWSSFGPRKLAIQRCDVL